MDSECDFKMASNTNDHLRLPEDLLIEIFLRSSVESLLRAKCVCKKWYALVNNSTFVLNHLQYQKSHDKGCLLLHYFREETEQHNFALFDDETLMSDAYHDLDHFQLRNYTFYVEGPIDGMYCLFNGDERIVLWNPALREFRELPLPHPHFFPHVKVDLGNIGFGRDPLTHDYKLVLIRVFYDDFHSHPCSRYVTVYNLTTNNWRLLNVGNSHLLEYSFCESRNSSFLNGIYHWWTTSGVIIAFDMGKETFRQILGPDLSHSESLIGFRQMLGPYPSWSEYLIGSLTIYNDKVALVLRNEFSVDIWVMLEESVWIKQFSVDSLPKFYGDIGLWKNDGFLFSIPGFETFDVDHNSQMILYNANTQERRNVGPRGVNKGFRASVYLESLVSVGCGTEHKGKCSSLNTISEFFVKVRR